MVATMIQAMRRKPNTMPCAAAVATRGAGMRNRPSARAMATGIPAPAARLLPEESAFFSDLEQLTFGGENAEAYWSFDGRQLSFQARPAGESCDRIYRMNVDGRPGAPVPVSSGKGATTCAHFF